MKGMEKKTNYVVHILLGTERTGKRNVCVRKELKKRRKLCTYYRLTWHSNAHGSYLSRTLEKLKSRLCLLLHGPTMLLQC